MELMAIANLIEELPYILSNATFGVVYLIIWYIISGLMLFVYICEKNRFSKKTAIL